MEKRLEAKSTHDFQERDNINSYMGRCIYHNMQNGLERWRAHSICMSEYLFKSIKKKMK